MHRVKIVLRLHHVVFFVAAQSVLWTEGGSKPHIGEGGESVQGMDELARDRGRVRQQGDAPAMQRDAQLAFCEQTIKAGLHVQVFRSEATAPK